VLLTRRGSTPTISVVVLGGELAVPFTRNPLSGAECPPAVRHLGTADTKRCRESGPARRCLANPVRAGRQQRYVGYIGCRRSAGLELASGSKLIGWANGGARPLTIMEFKHARGEL
jgi:hypothetical protein